MKSLTSQVLNYAEAQPEGTPLTAKGLLHLSNRAAIDQTLSRLARRGKIIRVGRGVYARPITSRFGVRAPLPHELVEQYAATRGETIVPSGAAAANALGLTTQVPVRTVYLTSGPSRHLSLGKQSIELRHAKRWELLRGNERVGQAARALAWLGPNHVARSLRELKGSLEPKEIEELQSLRPALPGWLAKQISASMAANG